MMGYLLSTLAMIFYGALLLVWMSPVFAGPYVEIGASVMDGCITDYDEKRKMQGCSNNPFGLLAVGYEYNGFAIEAEHRSSLVEKDPGFNALTVKYRWEWK
jgi:hypothetical protein